MSVTPRRGFFAALNDPAVKGPRRILRWLLFPAFLLAVIVCVGLLWPKPKPASQGLLLVEVEARLRPAVQAPWKIDRVEWADFVGRRVETDGKWVHALLSNSTDRVRPTPGGKPEPAVEELWFGRPDTSLVQHPPEWPASQPAMCFLGAGADTLVLRTKGSAGAAWPALAEILATAFELPVMDVDGLWCEPRGGEAEFLTGANPLDGALKKAHADTFGWSWKSGSRGPKFGARRFGDCVYLWIEHPPEEASGYYFHESQEGRDFEAQRSYLLRLVHQTQPDARSIILYDVRADGQGVNPAVFSNTDQADETWPAIPLPLLPPTEPQFPGSPAAD